MNIKQNFKVSLAEFSKIFQCFSSIKQNVKKVKKIDNIWQNLTKFDKIWQNLTKFDKIWQNLTKSSKI
jgi:hypothetical protein